MVFYNMNTHDIVIWVVMWILFFVGVGLFIVSQFTSDIINIIFYSFLSILCFGSVVVIGYKG